jgi:hypothetical protein
MMSSSRECKASLSSDLDLMNAAAATAATARLPPSPSPAPAPSSPPPLAMDAEYVMFLPADGSLSNATTERRRKEAMKQWIRARADEEYLEAMECVRAEEAVGSVAWRTFQSINSGRAVLCVHTAEGESLTTDHYPLSFHFDRRTVVAPAGDSLIDALTKIESDEIIRWLQPYDPLSWFCVPSVGWHEWFYWMAADPRVRSIPRVRVFQPPSLKRPVTSEPAAEHDVVRRNAHSSSLTINIDTLAWPTARSVTTPTSSSSVPPPPIPLPLPSPQPQQHLLPVVMHTPTPTPIPFSVATVTPTRIHNHSPRRDHRQPSAQPPRHSRSVVRRKRGHPDEFSYNKKNERINHRTNPNNENHSACDPNQHLRLRHACD